MIRKAFTVWATYMWVVGVSSKIIWGSNTGNQTRCTETTSDKTCDDEVTTGFLLRSSSLHFSCTTTRWNHWVASEKSEQRCCDFGTQPLFWFLTRLCPTVQVVWSRRSSACNFRFIRLLSEVKFIWEGLNNSGKVWNYIIYISFALLTCLSCAGCVLNLLFWGCFLQLDGIMFLLLTNTPTVFSI